MRRNVIFLAALTSVSLLLGFGIPTIISIYEEHVKESASEVLRISDMDHTIEDKVLSENFTQHLMMNLERYWTVRFWLYAFYFAMISALLTIYFQGATGSKMKRRNIKKVFLFGAAIGQVVVILQIIISMQIRGGYDSLALIFNHVDFINRLSVVDSELRDISTNPFMIFTKYPYLPALVLLFATNIGLWLFGLFENEPPMWIKRVTNVRCWLTIIYIGLLAISILYLFERNTLNNKRLELIKKELNIEVIQPKSTTPDSSTIRFNNN